MRYCANNVYGQSFWPRCSRGEKTDFTLIFFTNVAAVISELSICEIIPDTNMFKRFAGFTKSMTHDMTWLNRTWLDSTWHDLTRHNTTWQLNTNRHESKPIDTTHNTTGLDTTHNSITWLNTTRHTTTQLDSTRHNTQQQKIEVFYIILYKSWGLEYS